MTSINVYQLVSPSVMYNNRYAIKAVCDYAWKGSYEVQVDTATGFFHARRKMFSDIGMPITEQNARQKIIELFAAYDFACARHRQMQRTGVKEMFGNLTLVSSVSEAAATLSGLGNVRMYFRPYLKVSEKDSDAPVMQAEVIVTLGKNYNIIDLSYKTCPIKQIEKTEVIAAPKELSNPRFIYLFSPNKNIITPYYYD